MYRLDSSLNQLIEKGRQQGFLTFSQVNAYLPDEAVNPEKLDNLLMSLDELGMQIVADEKLPVTPEIFLKRSRFEGQADQIGKGRRQVASDRRSGADVSDANG